MFKQFEMERFQSLYENEVKYNLSDSGNHPMSINQLLNKEEVEALLNMEIFYGYSKGDPRLCEAVSMWYPEKASENILITNGSAEANFVITTTLIEPGDEVVLILPNYMQIPGIVKNLGAKVKNIYLKEELDWHIDMDEMRSLVTPKTKLISICNPSNPTGAVMSDSEMEALASIAREYDVFVHSDEVYRGSELNGIETKSFAAFYEKAIISCGLSKSFAHPGLRIGWVVADTSLINDMWSRKDYSSITSSVLSQEIAIKVMSETNKEKILSRSSIMLESNLQLFQRWLNAHNNLFSFVPPKAGGMAFVGYQMDINSTKFAHKLRTEQSVLIVPGDHYGMDGYLRFGIGSESNYLEEGLSLISDSIKSLGY
mgnify:FL=1|jgi:hypothetical protein